MLRPTYARSHTHTHTRPAHVWEIEFASFTMYRERGVPVCAGLGVCTVGDEFYLFLVRIYVYRNGNAVAHRFYYPQNDDYREVAENFQWIKTKTKRFICIFRFGFTCAAHTSTSTSVVGNYFGGEIRKFCGFNLIGYRSLKMEWMKTVERAAMTQSNREGDTQCIFVETEDHCNYKVPPKRKAANSCDS